MRQLMSKAEERARLTSPIPRHQPGSRRSDGCRTPVFRQFDRLPRHLYAESFEVIGPHGDPSCPGRQRSQGFLTREQPDLNVGEGHVEPIANACITRSTKDTIDRAVSTCSTVATAGSITQAFPTPAPSSSARGSITVD